MLEQKEEYRLQDCFLLLLLVNLVLEGSFWRGSHALYSGVKQNHKKERNISPPPAHHRLEPREDIVFPASLAQGYLQRMAGSDLDLRDPQCCRTAVSLPLLAPCPPVPHPIPVDRAFLIPPGFSSVLFSNTAGPVSTTDWGSQGPSCTNDPHLWEGSEQGPLPVHHGAHGRVAWPWFFPSWGSTGRKACSQSWGCNVVSSGWG